MRDVTHKVFCHIVSSKRLGYFMKAVLNDRQFLILIYKLLEKCKNMRKVGKPNSFNIQLLNLGLLSLWKKIAVHSELFRTKVSFFCTEGWYLF